MDVLLIGTLVVVGGLIACCLIWFVYNLIQSLSYTAKAARAPKGSALGRESLTHSERIEQLPKLPIPVARYSRAHGRIAFEDIPDADPSSLLDRFEELVVDAGHEKLFFGRLSSKRGIDDANTSMLIGLQATVATRFLGWISLQRYGSYVEWHLICSEVRLFRTPTEQNSHFEYSEHQNERPQNKQDDWAAGLLNLLWDAIFSNLTSKQNGSQAQWFQRFMMEMWVDALEESAQKATKATTTIMTPPVQIPPESGTETAETPGTQRRRPERRD